MTEQNLLQKIMDRQSEMSVSIGRMEAMLATLAGNGQPGRVGRIEEAIEAIWKAIAALRDRTAYSKGYLAGLVLAASVVGAAAAEILRWIRH